MEIALLLSDGNPHSNFLYGYALCGNASTYFNTVNGHFNGFMEIMLWVLERTVVYYLYSYVI